jgi:hypothetical protein
MVRAGLLAVALLLQPSTPQLSVEEQVARSSGSIEIRYCMS